MKKVIIYTVLILVVFLNYSLNCKLNVIDSINKEKHFEIDRMDKIIGDYKRKHKSEVIKLLEESFQKLGANKYFKGIDTSNIIFFPLIEFNDSTALQNGEKIFQRLYTKQNNSFLEGKVIYRNPEDSACFMKIHIVNKENVPSWGKTLKNRNFNSNHNHPTNAIFSLYINNYWIYVRDEKCDDEYTEYFDLHQFLNSFSLYQINSNLGYNLGGFDFTNYLILNNVIFEEEKSILKDFNYNLNQIRNLDSNTINKHNLENILFDELLRQNPK